jgi:hypothetical protein
VTSAIALFVFGAITVALSLQLPIGSVRAPDSGLFPLALGVLLMGLAAGHGAQAWLARPGPAAAPPAKPDDAGATRRVVLFMGAVVTATALLVPLGYLLTSFLMMLALLWVLGLRRLHVAGLIAAASAVACQLIFVRWLRIPLPPGVLGF